MILQANIGGYTGRAATVIGYFDMESQTLLIKAVDGLKASRFNGAGLITNQPSDDCDYHFSEQDFAQAFRDFRYFQYSDRLIFENAAQRAMPQVEINKITESGSDLAISPSTTNEQMAVLALCFFARVAGDSEKALSMHDELSPYFSI